MNTLEKPSPEKTEFYEKVSYGDPSPRTDFMKSLFRYMTLFLSTCIAMQSVSN